MAIVPMASQGHDIDALAAAMGSRGTRTPEVVDLYYTLCVAKGARCHGLTPDPVQLELARQHASRQGLDHVQLRAGQGQRLSHRVP